MPSMSFSVVKNQWKQSWHVPQQHAVIWVLVLIYISLFQSSAVSLNAYGACWSSSTWVLLFFLPLQTVESSWILKHLAQIARVPFDQWEENNPLLNSSLANSCWQMPFCALLPSLLPTLCSPLNLHTAFVSSRSHWSRDLAEFQSAHIVASYFPLQPERGDF